MKFWVGITDYDWFNFHASKTSVDEVNFWRPSSKKDSFKALPLGGPFLFKLKSPHNYIAGGGFFVRYEPLPLSLAWETFGEANGAATEPAFRYLISRNRSEPIQFGDDPSIGCIILTEPFFFQNSDRLPFRLAPGIQRGRSYDTSNADGFELWQEIQPRIERARIKSIGPATMAAQDRARFGNPTTVMPRLGQGSFRLLITDAYGKRCAITSERTLPALEAAHIHRYSHGGDHSLSNGLLLRSDLHRLFDRGYLAIDPISLKIRVSPRIKEEFENGRDYYALEKEGRTLRHPLDPRAFPSQERLARHYEDVFKKTA
jgi:putative restriction endonuclease